MNDSYEVVTHRKAKLDMLRHAVRVHDGPVTESQHYAQYAQMLVSNDLIDRPSLIDLVIEAGRDVDQLENMPRDRMEVLSALGEEYGELSTEVRIAQGLTYKKPSPDRVFGEAIDVLLVALDMIYVDNRHITEAEITTYAARKLNKWKQKVSQMKITKN